MRPFTFTGLTAPVEPSKRDHTAGRCYCGMRHTPIEAAQYNQPVHYQVPRPDVIIRGERSRLSRQQDASGWLAAHQTPLDSTDVRSLLGAEHWASQQQPDDKAPQVCWCGEPIVGKPGKRYCKPSHRVTASRKRRAEAAAAMV